MMTQMYPFTESLRFFGIYLCLHCILHAAPSKLESNSPFLPPGYRTFEPPSPPPVQPPGNPLALELEFRGVVQIDGIYQFSLFKKSENRGYWIPEGGAENEIGVSDFDADSMRITVTYNGRSEQISLMSASGNPLPVVANAPFAPTETKQTSPALPSSVELPGNAQNKPSSRRTIPRRRVILPPKR